MTKLEEAKSTCNGLHHLMRRLNGAAVDLDKGGESAHELLALLATCLLYTSPSPRDS